MILPVENQLNALLIPFLYVKIKRKNIIYLEVFSYLSQ